MISSDSNSHDWRIIRTPDHTPDWVQAERKQNRRLAARAGAVVLGVTVAGMVIDFATFTPQERAGTLQKCAVALSLTR